MNKSEKILYLILLLMVALLVALNVYWIYIPTVFDTYGYLLGSNANYLQMGGLKLSSVVYTIFKMLNQKVDIFMINSFIVSVGFMVYLLFSYLLFTKVLNDKKGGLIGLLIFNLIFLIGKYRFFYDNYVQIFIFISIVLCLYLQLSYIKSSKKDYLYLKYFFLIYLLMINDFGIFLLFINILYDLRKFIWKLKYYLLLLFIVYLVIFVLVKFDYIVIPYTTGTFQKFYDILFYPFIRGPRFTFFESFGMLFGPGLSGYAFMVVFVLGLYGFKKNPLSSYVIFFILAYTLILFVMPKANSFPRYMTYYYPFIGLVFINLVYQVIKNTNKNLIFIVIFMFFIVKVKSFDLYNEFLSWNWEYRYGLQYKIAKEILCPYFNQDNIYLHKWPSYELGYLEAGCKSLNMYNYEFDYRFGYDPIKTILDKKIKFLVFDKIVESRFDYKIMLQENYLNNKYFTLSGIVVNDNLSEKFGKSFGQVKEKFRIYKIDYSNNLKYNTLESNDNQVVMDADLDMVFVHLNLGSQIRDDYLMIGEQKVLLSDIEYYKEKEWSNVIFPLKIKIPKGKGIVFVPSSKQNSLIRITYLSDSQ